MTSGSVIINELNLNTGIVHKEHQLIYANYYWHKIFVQNASKYSRDFVLRAIMNAVYPLDFIPVCYNVEGEYVTFMLKNCGTAISELCRLNLTIPHPDTQKNLPPFKLAIHLKHSHASELKIDIQNSIATILKRRYNAQTKTLNLEAFIKDPELVEFCPLSQPKLMYFVLHLSKDYEIETLKLNMNEIEIINPLEALHSERMCKTLSVLDLRKNNIKDPTQLAALKPYPITDLMIDDNPFCENMNEQEYIKLIRTYCCKIVKLDGCRIPPFGKSFRRNFLCNPIGHNFVDQFLEHYFTLYDSPDRHSLLSMYHKNAMFSVTCKNNMPYSNLYEYSRISRNILKLSDFSKCNEMLHMGHNSISTILKTLPTTEHDPYSFTVDLTMFNERNAMLTVTGVFKEPADRLLAADRDFGFSRTFVLQPTGTMEWLIVNEMLCVYETTLTQQAQSFKIVKVPRNLSSTVIIANTSAEKKEMINAFVALTCLQSEWAAKCLKECGFNLKSSLALFTDLFKADKIPSYAFNVMDEETEESTSQYNTIETLTTKLAPTEIRKPSAAHTKPKPKPKIVNKPIVSISKELKVSGIKPIVATSKQTTIPAVKTVTSTTTSNTANITVTTTPKEQKKSSNTPAKESGKKDKVETKPADEIISTDIGDFKKYVKDPIILKCLNFSIDTSIDLVRESLDNAGKHILKKYTYAVKYYKAIGREFYRFQLYSSARTFLAFAMDTVTKGLGEQLYFIFTLLEIQYGEMKVAENMFLIIAETFQVEKTARFVGQDVARVNIQFARKLFDAIAISNLPVSKRRALLQAFIEFEKIYGNVETLTHANKLVQELKDSGLDPTPSSEKENTKPTVSSPKDETNPVSVDIPKPAPVAEVQEELKVPDPPNISKEILKNVEIIEIEDVPVLSPEEAAFIRFRERLLIHANISPKPIDDPLVERFKTLKDKTTLVKLGDVLLNQYNKNFFVLKILCKQWQKFLMSTKLANTLMNCRDNLSAEDKNFINPFILYLKVCDDLEKNKFTEAKDKIITHIRISPLSQIIPVFEDLMADINTHSKFLSEVLRDIASNEHFPNAKVKLITLIFLDFCQRQKSDAADKFYEQQFSGIKPFYPEYIAELDFVRKKRAKYANNHSGNVPKDLIRNLHQVMNDSFEGQLEEMRMHFYLKGYSKARHLRNVVQGKTPNSIGDDVSRFKMAASYYEAIHGSASVGLNTLNRLNEDNFNTMFILLLCLYQMSDESKLKPKVKQLFGDLHIIMNPYAQRLLYKYHQEWLRLGFNIFNENYLK